MFENIKKEHAVILDKTLPLCIKYTYIKSRVQNHGLNTTLSHIYLYIYDTCFGTIFT